MAYKLQLKRGASGSLPTGSAGEPLFTTDTNDLYIGTGAANQRFQKYIASGTSAQFLKGDGSLDSTTYTPTSRTLTINGTSFDLSANRTFNVGTVTTAAATTGGQVAFFNGATVITSVSGLYFDGVDKLGIGTASPTYNLDVTGTARMTGNLTAASLIKSGGTSTQYLMADGSTSTITNPVTGTGTTNYLPKWTSGSGLGNSLVYDNGSVVNIGTTSGLSKFAVADNSNTFSVHFSASNISQGIAFGSSGSVGVIQGYNTTFTTTNAISINNSGGNLLVGTTTDNGNRLQVTGNGYFSGNVGINTTTLGERLNINGGLGFQSSGTQNWHIASNASNNLVFTRSGIADRMTLSSDGNLGLGVVPSAWDAAFKVFQIGLTSLYTESSVASKFGNNIYYSSGNKYYQNGEASQYVQQFGTHVWQTAPSGTAGNPITFTQAMTLTASGRLLLGTTTEGTYLLDVNGSGRFSETSWITKNQNGVTSINLVNDNLNNAAGQAFRFYYNTSTPLGGIFHQYNATTGAYDLDLKVWSGFSPVTRFFINGSTGAATFSSSVTATSFVASNATANITLLNGTADAQQIRVRMSGNNGVLDVTRNSGAAPDLIFGTEGTERARITSGGNLLVGTTTDAGYKLSVNGGIYGKGITADSDGTVGNAIYGYGQVLSGSSTNALVQLNTTWNTTGNADAIVLDVTNTASGASSRLIDLKVGGASIFKVQRNGRINASSLPTSSAGLSAGDIWNDGGTLKIV